VRALLKCCFCGVTQSKPPGKPHLNALIIFANDQKTPFYTENSGIGQKSEEVRGRAEGNPLNFSNLCSTFV